MKRIVAVSVTLAVFALPAAALAASPGLVRQYNHTYWKARREFGSSAVGCNLTGRKGSCHVRVTNNVLTQSLRVLDRLWAPPAPSVPYVKAYPAGGTVNVPAPSYAPRTASYASPTRSYGTSGTAYASPPVSSGGGGNGLESCIIQHESGGNPQATNGQYSGIGQWQESTWLADGGGKYSSTPLGASYAQQAAVLESEGAAGMQQQQGQYDGC